MQDDVKLKIIENNKIINRLLLENEQLVKSKGLKPPSSNYALDNKERLKIPSGYIRISDLFSSKYYLDLIVIEKRVNKNIAYSLQFYNLVRTPFIAFLYYHKHLIEEGQTVLLVT